MAWVVRCHGALPKSKSVSGSFGAGVIEVRREAGADLVDAADASARAGDFIEVFAASGAVDDNGVHSSSR